MDESGLTRRNMLVRTAVGMGAATTLSGLSIEAAQAARLPAVPPVEVKPGLSIYPRDAWGLDLKPKKPSRAETPQFLLVHHTATNVSLRRDPRAVIRSIYSYQTGPAKRWRDVCYQFFVSPDGRVYEARAGSLAGPVEADATAGSQGFAQMVCVLGDYNKSKPTAAAQSSLVMVLAWMAERYSIETGPGATTSFVSRGSNRWRKGVQVTTPTIVGHRAMSKTSCPGKHLNALLPVVRTRADEQRQLWAAPSP